MELDRIKKMAEDRKKDKNEVADLLAGVRRTQGDSELINDVPLRMSEINSLIVVMQAALETSYDEDFYKAHIGRLARTLEGKFDELQVLIDALVAEKWAREKKIVTAA